ncbi:hypothetical protein ACFLSU_07605 [Bacteroidota bacterium]
MKIFNKNNKDKTILVDVDKRLKEQKESELALAKTDGENIASNNPPKEIKYLINIPTLQRIYASYNSLSAEISEIYQRKLEKFFTKNQQALADFNSPETTEAKAELADIENEEKTALDEAVASHDESIENKKETLKEVRGNVKNFKNSLRSIKHYRVWPKNIIGSILIALILLGEIHMNADSFMYCGFSELYAKFIGIAVATVSFMLGIALAYIIRTNWLPKTKILTSIGIVLLVFGMYLTLGTIRISMMTAQAETDGLFGLTALHFVVFNLAFFVSIFGVKFFIFPTPEMLKSNEEHKEASDKLKHEEKKLKKIENEINNAHASRKKAKNDVKASFAPRTAEIKNKITVNSNRIKDTALSYNETLSTAKNFYTQVNNDYMMVASTLFATINLFRNDGVSLPIPDLKHLDNAFANYKPLKTFNGAIPKKETQS